MESFAFERADDNSLVCLQGADWGLPFIFGVLGLAELDGMQ